MRRLLTCLLVLACGCGDANDADKGGGAGQSANGGRGGAGGTGGSGGKSGSAANGGSGGASGKGGAGPLGGSGGSGSGGTGSGGSGGSGTTLGMIKLVPNVVAGKQSGGSGNGVGVGSQASALRVGSPSATTLLSLKYYITSIQLCEDAELMGSGWKSMSGCISLYQNMPAGSPDYNTYTVVDAKDDVTPGRYVDLMSADGQAALRQPVMVQVPVYTSEEQIQDVDDADGGVPEAPVRQPGVYRYGFINFYRPIKVKAEFPIIGEPGNFFRTKAVTDIHQTMLDNGFLSDRVDIGDTTSGNTEETTYMLNNGGALFVFQKPFAITQADVEAKAEIAIDLVFNPENFGQAYASNDCANDVRVVVCDRTNNVAIDMPFVRMSPVPRKQGERTRKETYLVDYDDNSKLRIELYYNGADSEASIQGVDTAIVYNSGAVPAGSSPSFNTVASNFVVQHGSVSTNDASVTLLDYQRSVNLEDLVRRKDGTVTIHCLFPGSICSTVNETITRGYTYVDDRVVSGN